MNWKPTPRQTLFLSASDFEVLYGGAAGGGKSDALLVDAAGLQQHALANRNYQAILFRRTYPDLKDLIDRSLDIYPNLFGGGKYDKQAHVWRWPSGARIEFGYLQYDSDRLKYRGRAFTYIGWDELTLFPTAAPYLYLLSRLRTTDKSLKCYVRATTNSDGPGFRWVKDYWRIPTEGTATRFEHEISDPETASVIVRNRRFIPAKLSDNPHLAGSGYRETLLMLPDAERDALLMGRWEAPEIKGAYYAKQVESLRAAGQICTVKVVPGVPVNTFWDLGFNDTTVLWFHQLVGKEHRFVDYLEANGQALSYFALALQGKGYLYGTHYLPHDARNKTLAGSGKSIEQQLREMLPGQQFAVVPRVENVISGISQTRDMLPLCWFDADKCANGLAALEAYQKEYSDKLQAFMPTPLHNWASNGADAFRQFAQGFRDAVPPKKEDIMARLQRLRQKRTSMTA